jgi:hypothetical protein
MQALPMEIELRYAGMSAALSVLAADMLACLVTDQRLSLMRVALPTRPRR